MIGICHMLLTLIVTQVKHGSAFTLNGKMHVSSFGLLTSR